MSAIGRVGTWTAVGALGVNAVLLGVAGLVAGRPLLLLGAAGATAAAIGVILGWRRHRSSLDAMRRDRLALRGEVRALGDLIRRGR